MEAVEWADHLSAIGVEAACDIFAESDVGGPLKLDVIVVIEIDQFTQPQRSGQARGFAGHPLLHFTIANDRIGAVVDDVVAGAVGMHCMANLDHSEFDAMPQLL